MSCLDLWLLIKFGQWEAPSEDRGWKENEAAVLGLRALPLQSFCGLAVTLCPKSQLLTATLSRQTFSQSAGTLPSCHCSGCVIASACCFWLGTLHLSLLVPPSLAHTFVNGCFNELPFMTPFESVICYLPAVWLVEAPIFLFSSTFFCFSTFSSAIIRAVLDFMFETLMILKVRVIIYSVDCHGLHRTPWVLSGYHKICEVGMPVMPLLGSLPF